MISQYGYGVLNFLHLSHSNKINIIFRFIKNMKNQGANDL